MNQQYEVISGGEAFYHDGNDTGILLCHGFGGTASSLKYLGSQLAKEGYTVSCPRIKGHGTHYKDLEMTNHVDWIETIESAFEELVQRCSEVFVIGFSMGGTLTLHLAEKYQEIAGICVINAAIDLPNMQKVYEQAAGERVQYLPSALDVKNPHAEGLSYSYLPLRSMEQLFLLTDSVREQLHRIDTPLLVISSIEDHDVPPENAQLIYELVSSEEKQFLQLENSYHMATIDYDQELVAETCCDFVKDRLHT